MAFDGVVIAALVKELKEKLVGGRVMKISQPERDELMITIKNYDQYKLLLSADASLPLIYLTDTAKEAPLQSPAFCMLLRKHLQSAKVLDISQPKLERVIFIDLEHLDDMGDLKRKRLIIEIMGKHSNIIFCDDTNKIIDSIKRVPASVSSVREVLPGRDYFIPQTLEKENPFEISEQVFTDQVLKQPFDLSKALYNGMMGISPVMANEIIFRASLSPDLNAADIGDDIAVHLYKTFARFMEDVKEGGFSPAIIYSGEIPKEFAAVKLTYMLADESYSSVDYESISELLESYYKSRNTVTRIRQRSSDLLKVVSNAIGRVSKKYELQLKQLADTEKRDKYRVYGELLTTYGYSVVPGEKSVTVNNYYTGEDIDIPLDPEVSAIDNAKAYFDKYSKLKRTYEALSKYIVESKEELEHLESVKISLDIARHEEDLEAIREELSDFGYMKKHLLKNGKQIGSQKKGNKKSGRKVCVPFTYVTEEGFTLLVGKNNYQNDELTFKIANGGDWWFHAKGVPGSHVVLKTEGKEIPDNVFEKAASLAAFYSKNKDNDKVEVDYLERKNVKKPNGSKPGFVVYYTNYSMIAVPSLEGLTLCP